MGESNLPARRTKEIATTHLETERTEYTRQQKAVRDNLEQNEDGKEDFDFVLKKMSSPPIISIKAPLKTNSPDKMI